MWGQTMPDNEKNSIGNNGNTAQLMAKLLLTREEVSQLLEVPADTIANLHRVRLLPGVKVGKHLRWKPEDVRQYVESLAPEND